MIVDDDEICLMLHKQVLLNSEFHESPVTYNSAEKALAFLNRLSEPQQPVLIFLDINMPDMNGWEFLDILHQEDFGGEQYVVMVSSSVDIRDKEKAASYDKVIGFIEKPFTNGPLSALRLKLPGF
jgi:CheY-like chemotaxis protein